MSDERFRNAVEAALFAAGRPLLVDELVNVFADSEWRAERADVRAALAELAEAWQQRGLELVEVASGWRFQVRRDYSAWLGRLWSDKPPRYSRALMETLAIIAYRQPVTRGEIEDIRGVAVSPSILKTLQERDWIRTLGHKEVPGRPELLGTTRQFLDDFGLASLETLPPLAEIRDLDSMPDDLFPETRPQAGDQSPADAPATATAASAPGAPPQPAVEPDTGAVDDDAEDPLPSSGLVPEADEQARDQQGADAGGPPADGPPRDRAAAGEDDAAHAADDADEEKRHDPPSTGSA